MLSDRLSRWPCWVAGCQPTLQAVAARRARSLKGTPHGRREPSWQPGLVIWAAIASKFGAAVVMGFNDGGEGKAGRGGEQQARAGIRQFRQLAPRGRRRCAFLGAGWLAGGVASWWCRGKQQVRGVLVREGGELGRLGDGSKHTTSLHQARQARGESKEPGLAGAIGAVGTCLAGWLGAGY